MIIITYNAFRWTDLRLFFAWSFMFLLLFLPHKDYSQTTDFSQDYFRSPVDFRMLLSGTFGEFRPDHFHSGIDIKTGGAEGKAVYAVADGYVSRIKVSPGGFGKALYVTHPNGYVSVYGHLSEYKTPIRQYIVSEQYKKRSYDIDISVGPGLFPVKKGEVIALSGNTGSSGGPHLHFEIRYQSSEHPIDPLLFGLEVKDNIRPKMISVKLYAMDAYSRINGKTDSVVVPLEGWGPAYQLAGSDTIELSGNISFGLQTYDVLNDADNKNGIFSVELLLDDERCFYFITSTFSFDETRYVNSVIDYAEYKTTGRRYLRTCIDPNNRFSGYDNVKNRGILMFDDTQVHKLEYVVKDVHGNTSDLIFYARSQKMLDKQPYLPFPEKFDRYHFFYYLPNKFESDNFKLEIPSGALYDNMVFEYATSEQQKNMLSLIHHVHNKLTPLHKPATISIKPSETASGLEDKLYLVLLEAGTTTAINSTFKGGMVVGKSSQFGNYSVMADTVKPVIKPVNFYNGKTLTGFKQLKLLIIDNESGIGSYEATLNGEWILMEYDVKNDLLIYNFDRYLVKGSNTFRIEVSDKKGNKNVFETKLIY